MQIRSLWLVVILGITAAAPALAESGVQALARRHYEEGQALFRARSYSAALAEFRAAHNAAPHPVTLKGQAECLERIGRIREAVELFEQYIRAMPTASDADSVRRRIARHRRRPGRLRVISTPPGAMVTIDGGSLNPRTPFEIDVSPGRHAVAVQLEGYQVVLEEFDMVFASGYTIQANLVPIGDGQAGTPGYPTESGQWRVTTSVWAMIGVAGAGLITGIVTGSLALSNQGDFDDRVTGGVTGENRAELEELGDGGQTKALVADISFGIAGAAAITGLILFFVQNRNRGSQSRSSPQDRISPFTLTPSVTEGGGSLTIGGSF